MRRSTPWRQSRRTRERRRILLALLTDAENLKPWAICVAAQISPGRAWVILANLERHGHVTAEWEDRPDGRPPGRFYRLTEDGRTHAFHELGLTPRKESPMICPPCARAADAAPGAGHRPDVCENWGRDIRACGCQHTAEAPPSESHDSQAAPR